MFKNLYDNFAHWFHDDRGTIYFYSDPHFNDPEVVNLRKNYIGDEEQVKRINSKIGKYDTLVVLGDVGDVEWVRKIRGYKVLVMGNHDAGATNYKRIRSVKYFSPNIIDGSEEDAMLKQCLKVGYKYKDIEINEVGNSRAVYEYDNQLFDEIYEGALMIAPNIILSHEPVNFPYAANIHGHCHDINCNDKLNMCAEHINYTPVKLTDLIKSGLLKTPDIHREAIDRAIDRKERQ